MRVGLRPYATFGSVTVTTRPPSGVALARDLAAVRARHVARDGEAEADAAGFAVARRFDAPERREHEFELVLRNSGPLVGDADGRHFSVSSSETCASSPCFTAFSIRLRKARFMASGWQSARAWFGPE